LASITVDGWDCLRHHRVGDAWRRARAHAVDFLASDTTPDQFGAIVTITSPGSASLLTALKPVLDGLIAALHRYNDRLVALSVRLARGEPAVGADFVAVRSLSGSTVRSPLPSSRR
jgi:hypothetical protein